MNATATVNDINTKRNSKIAIEGAKRGTLFYVSPYAVTIIGLDTDDGPEHPHYDKRILRPLEENEIKNTAAYGVIKNVVVKKDGDRLIVIDGRSRVRRARAVFDRQEKAGEETIMIPVTTMKGDDTFLYGVSRAANIHTIDDALTNAENARRLMAMGRDEKDIAVTFGVSESTVRNWLALLDVAPEVMDQVRTGAVPMTSAVAVASLPAAQQAEVIAEASANGAKPTVENVRRVRAEKTGKAPTNSNTPKERIAKAETILRKLAKQWVTDKVLASDMEEALSKITKALGIASSMDALCEEVAE